MDESSAENVPKKVEKGQTGKTGRSPTRDLAASLLAGGATFKDAAAGAQMGERTLRRWFAEDADFRSEVATLRAAMVSAAAGRLADGMTEAADVLRKLMTNEDANVRLKAAAKVVELGLKVRNQDEIEERLAAVESAIAGGGDHGRDTGKGAATGGADEDPDEPADDGPGAVSG